MKGLRYLFLISFMIVLAACQKDIPEPETELKVEPINTIDIASDIPVSGVESNSKDPFFIRYQVKGSNVLVECIVQGISFREQSTKNKGKIILYVDGKKKEEISSAAFIVKGLSPGTHRIKLELVKDKQPASGLKREFYVMIP